MCAQKCVENIDEMISHFINECKRAGLKVTHQRTEIYRILLIIPDHPSAETLYKRLLPTLPTISLDTVYRTLSTLEQHGLVNRIQTSESQARFEAVIANHHHLICSNGKDVMDVHWPEIESLDLPEAGDGWGKSHSRNLIMYGVCSTCSGK